MKKINYIIYIIIEKFVSFFGRFSLGHCEKISNFLGDIIRFIDLRHKEIAVKNIKSAYKNELSKYEIDEIVKKVYRNLSGLISEIGWIKTNSFDKIKSRVIISGFTDFKEKYEKNKGLLIISAHIGVWELLPFMLSKMGLKINIVYRPLDFSPLNKFVKGHRVIGGNRLISKKSSMEKIINILSFGECVGLLIDQSANWYDGIWIDFFGQNACTSNGTAKIALNSKVTVIPVFMVRFRGKYKILFEKEILLKKTGNSAKDIELSTLNYTKLIENIVNIYSEQWLWVHNRWKNKPYCILNKKKVNF